MNDLTLGSQTAAAALAARLGAARSGRRETPRHISVHERSEDLKTGESEAEIEVDERAVFELLRG